MAMSWTIDLGPCLSGLLLRSFLPSTMIPIPLGTMLEHGRIRESPAPVLQRSATSVGSPPIPPSAVEATGNETYRMTAVQSKRRIPDSGVRNDLAQSAKNRRSISSSGTVRRVDAGLNISSSNECLAGSFGSTSQ